MKNWNFTNKNLQRNKTMSNRMWKRTTWIVSPSKTKASTTPSSCPACFHSNKLIKLHNSWWVIRWSTRWAAWLQWVCHHSICNSWRRCSKCAWKRWKMPTHKGWTSRTRPTRKLSINFCFIRKTISWHSKYRPFRAHSSRNSFILMPNRWRNCLTINNPT